MISRILVPMGGSEMAEHALEFALETYPDAEITVLHVVGAPTPFMGEAVRLALEEDFPRAAEERAAGVFERARELAAENGTEIDTVVGVGQPSRVIVEHAADADLIVIGSHGRQRTSRVLIGNVAERVVRRSPVPVTVVR